MAGLALWVAAWRLDARAPSAREAKYTSLGIGPATPWLRPASDAILWAWAALVLVYFSHVPHKELRYVIPLAAPLFLLAGRGLAVLTRARTARNRAVSIGLVTLALAYTFAPLRHCFAGPFISSYVSEEKNVADYLNAHANQAGWLYTNFNYPVFGYYTRLKIEVVGEQEVSFYSTFPDNMPKDGYLIVYKQVPKEPTTAWADDDPHFRLMKDFPSLVIYEYRQAGFH